MPSDKADIKRYETNLKNEVEGEALYQRLAEAESDPSVADLYRRLAGVERRHAEFWGRRLREKGAPVPEYRAGRRVRVLGWLARRFGVDTVLPVVRSMEMGAVDEYKGQPEAEAAGLPSEERVHAQVFREMAASPNARSSSQIARLEGRHQVGRGNALRAAVMGANDGLVSNLSLVMGVAGASPGRDVVLLAGISGVLAGGFSMALGEWISVKSSAELYERQIAIEAAELASVPAEEIEELALIYQAKGIPRDQAYTMAESIVANPETALETLAREELGIDPREIGSPWVAGFTSLLLFTSAAVLPVLPFLFSAGLGSVVASALISAVALFGLGAGITLLTGRSVLFSGARQMAIGLGAALITYGIGKLLGAGLGLG